MVGDHMAINTTPTRVWVTHSRSPQQLLCCLLHHKDKTNYPSWAQRLQKLEWIFHFYGSKHHCSWIYGIRVNAWSSLHSWHSMHHTLFFVITDLLRPLCPWVFCLLLQSAIIALDSMAGTLYFFDISHMVLWAVCSTEMSLSSITSINIIPKMMLLNLNKIWELDQGITWAITRFVIQHGVQK